MKDGLVCCRASKKNSFLNGIISKVSAEVGVIRFLERIVGDDPVNNRHITTTIATAYINGSGVKKDIAKVRELCNDLADSGDPVAQVLIGCCCDLGGKEAQAVQLWKKSSDQGYSPADALIGNMYAKKSKRKDAAALRIGYYEMAAEKGEEAAQHELGICCLEDARRKDTTRGIWLVARANLFPEVLFLKRGMMGMRSFRYSVDKSCRSNSRLSVNQICDVIDVLGTEGRDLKRIAQNKSTLIGDLVEASRPSHEDLLRIHSKLAEVIPERFHEVNKSMVMIDRLIQARRLGVISNSMVPSDEIVATTKSGISAGSPEGRRVGLRVENPTATQALQFSHLARIN